MVKVAARPVDLNIIQVYAPARDHNDDVKLFYEQLGQVRYQCKLGEVIPVMGDLNAKVGRTVMECCRRLW